MSRLLKEEQKGKIYIYRYTSVPVELMKD